MLKIKDNVDLKELEKFGFEHDLILSNQLETIYSISNGYQKTCIEWGSKILFLYEPFNSNAFNIKGNILYDIIKADLVEKVNE